MKYLGVCVARAQQRFAQREAIAYAEHALGLLGRLPETPLRHKQELEFHLYLSVSLGVMRGYAAAEGRENYERARALCEIVGDRRQLFELVHARWYAQLVSAEIEGARESVDELARLAESLDGYEFRWRARLASGRTELWEGKFGAAVHALGRCVEDLEREPVELHAETYGAHPSVAVFIASGLASWFFGLPDQARAHSGLAVERAEKRGRPFDIAAALFQGARVELLCGHPERAASLAERAETICRDRDVAFFLPGSRFLVGAARVEQGEVDRGLSEMLRELAECRAVNGPFLSDFMLAFIATAYGRNRKWDEGLRRVDEGIRLAATGSDSVYAAELWRIKGELLLGKARAAKSDRSTAGECFRRSLEIARGQEARSLELRAAMSLVRMSRAHHGAHEARELLRAGYSTFTQGFDTRDLQDAKALLNDLAADVPQPGR